MITVPTITLEGDANGAPHLEPSAYANKFTGKYEHRTITGGVGHNLPQEAPAAFAQAVVDIGRLATEKSALAKNPYAAANKTAIAMQRFAPWQACNSADYSAGCL